MNTAYQVMHIEEYATVSEPDGDHDIELSWADGMLGVSPIFASREQAAAYVDAYANGHQVVEIACHPLAEDGYDWVVQIAYQPLAEDGNA